MFENHKILRVLILFGCASLSCFAATGQAEQPIDPSLANQFFQEAKSASDKDRGQLWGVALYGPMLFADPNTRTVVANQNIENGVLHKEGQVFAGKLPDEIGIANTATKWAGTTWTMVMWPLPEEKQRRVRLMMHELFHRVQDSIKLPGSNPSNRHLDSQDGRIWLRMELRALERALYEGGQARREAISDALYFRRYRQSLFPQALAEENALETNEGLAEYTGTKLGSHSEREALARASYDLRDANLRQSFTRSFAYATGPAYGLLFDAALINWRRKIKAGDDLGTMLQSAFKITLPPPSTSEAMLRAKRYDGEEIVANETAREKRRREAIARYRARLVD